MFSKVVRSGDMVEVYTYSTAIKVGFERAYDVVRRDGTELDEELLKRDDNLFRSRQTVRRIIWANMGDYTKFITLTYAKTTLDQKKVRRDVTTFVQAMRRCGYDMKYLYVLEHQSERGEREGNIGCWHVHMVLFVEQFIPKEDLTRCWKHGFVDINVIDDVKNLGAYVCKYITKENSAEFGCRVFSCSLGLNRGKEEHFYIEGCSDTTYDGLHPKDVIDALDVKFHSQMRHDYLMDGVGHAQIVNYYQGVWRDEDIIDLRKDLVDDEKNAVGGE